MPLRVFLACKEVVKNENVNEIIFYLKNKYLPHNEEQETFIEDIPSQEDQFRFEAISDSIKKLFKIDWGSWKHEP